MSKKVFEESRERIRYTAALNLDLLDQCQRFKGHIDDRTLEQFNRDDSDLRIRHQMYKLSARAIGKKVPEREYLHKETADFSSFGLTHFQENGGHVVRFYGSIGKGPGEISSDKFHEMLWGIPDDADVTIRFNSNGGDYKHSCEMAEIVAKRTGLTRAIIDGVCASGASVVAMKCAPIGIGQNAFLMCHFARVTLRPSLTAEDLEIATRKLRQTERELVSVYTHRWKGTTEELVAAMDAEREFVGHEAVEVGLADFVDDKATVATRDEINASVKKFTPEAWRERESKNFTKYKVMFERWKLAASRMAED
jgi:ATP-dependent protease ClpP protease subunit